MAAAAILLAALALTAEAAAPYAGALPAQPAVETWDRAIPDVEVVDQDGRRLRFVRDLLRGRTVVMSFIYTSCTAACPLVGRAFAGLQAALHEAGRDDVFLLSLSLDPENDTPERLERWGERFGARPGWHLLTGEKSAMDELLRALTGDPARPGAHSDAVLVVDRDLAVFRPESAFAGPAYLLRILDEIRRPAADRPRPPGPSDATPGLAPPRPR